MCRVVGVTIRVLTDKTRVVLLGIRGFKQAIDGKEVVSLILHSEVQSNCTGNRGIDQKLARNPVDIFKSLRQVINNNIISVTSDKSMIRERIDCGTGDSNGRAFILGLEFVSWGKELPPWLGRNHSEERKGKRNTLHLRLIWIWRNNEIHRIVCWDQSWFRCSTFRYG